MTDSDDWAAGLSRPPKKPMKRGTKIFLWAFAALVAWLTLSNATWLAPDPVGKRVLIAHRGVSFRAGFSVPCVSPNLPERHPSRTILGGAGAMGAGRRRAPACERRAPQAKINSGRVG